MPVRRSITAATRGKVHRSVVNPCAGAPRRKAPSSPANSRAVNRGFRPARPAPFRPLRPATFQAAYHRQAVIGVTANVRATAACDSPRANRRAASNRRAANPAKSRRAPRGVPIPQRGMVAHVLHNSISRDSLGGLAGLLYLVTRARRTPPLLAEEERGKHERFLRDIPPPSG